MIFNELTLQYTFNIHGRKGCLIGCAIYRTVQFVLSLTTTEPREHVAAIYQRGVLITYRLLSGGVI
jgi:hypothetical protein